MIEQNTEEWLEMRKNKIGASDAPVIMGESPYCTPYQLWEEKMGLRVRETHAGMQYGHDMEPIVRSKLEKELLCTFEPSVIFHPNHEWMMASLDAFNKDSMIAAEIKNPNEEDHNSAKNGVVPQKYFAQLQHQIEILFALYGMTMIYYVSHRKGDVVILSVERDEKYISSMIKKEKAFFEGMLSFTAPAMTKRDYIPLDEEQAVSAAEELERLIPAIKEMKDREQELRKILIESAKDQNRTCGSLRLTRTMRSGSVDYSAIPELKSVDLEIYRKPPSITWRITINDKS